MTTVPEVFRRFEVQAAGRDELDHVESAFRTAVQASEGQVTILSIGRRPSLPVLEVRLRGVAPAVARVVGRVTDAGGRILQDLVDVPLNTLRPRVFPDPQPLLSIEADQGLLPPPPPAPPGGGRVTVAVVDSGLMLDHLDLRDHLWDDGKAPLGARCLDGKKVVEGDVTDEDGHGTMLVGTMLATAGFAPAIRIMPLKFFDGAIRPAGTNAAPLIDFAVKHDADIIDLSWDVGIECEPLRQAIGRACEAGKLVVFAAGNHGSNNDRSPSIPSLYAAEGRERAIVVMAVNRYGEKTWFSNYGDKGVDLGAPGVAILSTRPYLSAAAETGEQARRRYGVYNGTSAASAYVTGAAALLKAHDPGLTAEAIKNHLIASVDRPPDLRCLSRGRLNVAKALARLAQRRAKPVGTR